MPCGSAKYISQARVRLPSEEAEAMGGPCLFRCHLSQHPTPPHPCVCTAVACQSGRAVGEFQQHAGWGAAGRCWHDPPQTLWEQAADADQRHPGDHEHRAGVHQAPQGYLWGRAPDMRPHWGFTWLWYAHLAPFCSQSHPPMHIFFKALILPHLLLYLWLLHTLLTHYICVYLVEPQWWASWPSARLLQSGLFRGPMPLSLSAPNPETEEQEPVSEGNTCQWTPLNLTKIQRFGGVQPTASNTVSQARFWVI